MFEHPRFRIYPQHADYYRMAMVFRPFAMAVHEPGFRSQSVNTDEFGLRVQHHLDGTRVQWPRLRDRVDRCSVLVGNSSAFSNDASSDRATLSYRLNELRHRFFLNLGIRGASSTQEFFVFHLMQRYLPKIDDVVLLSGVITPTQLFDEALWFRRDWASISSEPFYRDQLVRHALEVGRLRRGGESLLATEARAWERFRAWLIEKFNTSDEFRYLALRYFGDSSATLPLPRLPLGFRAAAAGLMSSLRRGRRHPTDEAAPDPTATGPAGAAPPRAPSCRFILPPANDPAPTAADADERYPALIEQLANDLRGWAARAGTEFKLHYVLQPVIGWTRKELSPTEHELFELDKSRHPAIARFADPAFYARYRPDVESLCRSAAIEFHDSNEWMNAPGLAGLDLFTDVCHLTDEGNRWMARQLDARLAWRHAAVMADAR